MTRSDSQPLLHQSNVLPRFRPQAADFFMWLTPHGPRYYRARLQTFKATRRIMAANRRIERTKAEMAGLLPFTYVSAAGTWKQGPDGATWTPASEETER